MNSHTIIRIKRHLRSLALEKGRRISIAEASDALHHLGVRWNEDVRKVLLADVGTIRFVASDDASELLLVEEIP
ncbi:MAG: hypothetical protein MUC47_00405 [Candidatus Kapabacteria bacterium]|jgi:hypothetical protein|nr:hypothetical protein [Candidatus Kapabacteria bacterium]